MELTLKPWRITLEVGTVKANSSKWKVGNVADSHDFDEDTNSHKKLDPNHHQSEKSDPDLHQSEQPNPDPHQGMRGSARLICAEHNFSMCKKFKVP